MTEEDRIEEAYFEAVEVLENMCGYFTQTEPNVMLDRAEVYAPQVAERFGFDTRELRMRWAKHAGPAALQIALHPELSKLFSERAKKVEL